MGNGRRLSRTALEVLGAFVNDPGSELHGYELMKLAGVSSGSLYPILQRFEDDAWVEAAWENVDPAMEGRPRRRNYKVTGMGIAAYAAEVKELQRRLPNLVPGVAR